MTQLAEPTTVTLPAAIADRYAEIRRRLVDQLTTIAQLRADLSAGGDDADHATICLLLDEQTTLAAALQSQLKDLEAAAGRAASYGMCESCHQPIPAERLEIFPATTMCVNCKNTAPRH